MSCIVRHALIFTSIIVWYYLIYKSVVRDKERIFGEKKDWIAIIFATVATMLVIGIIIINGIVLLAC